MCKIVVLLIKPIAFVVFPLPLPSPSSDLKVPIAPKKGSSWIDNKIQRNFNNFFLNV